jgi:hypothetical protein
MQGLKNDVEGCSRRDHILVSKLEDPLTVNVSVVHPAITLLGSRQAKHLEQQRRGVTRQSSHNEENWHATLLCGTC